VLHPSGCSSRSKPGDPVQQVVARERNDSMGAYRGLDCCTGPRGLVSGALRPSLSPRAFSDWQVTGQGVRTQ